jgi:predicted DNA binding CopG/RHH family protein
MKKLKKIPYFSSEKKERDFWQKVDSTEYVDYSKLEKARFPNLKLTTKPITIRMPVSLLERIKVKANRLNIPYQSYIKQLIAQGI